MTYVPKPETDVHQFFERDARSPVQPMATYHGQPDVHELELMSQYMREHRDDVPKERHERVEAECARLRIANTRLRFDLDEANRTKRNAAAVAHRNWQLAERDANELRDIVAAWLKSDSEDKQALWASFSAWDEEWVQRRRVR